MSNDLKIEPLYSIFASLEGRSMARPVQHSYIVIRCLVCLVLTRAELILNADNVRISGTTLHLTQPSPTVIIMNTMNN